MPFRCIILGGGITGLSCAWYLKKKYGSSIHLTIVEKNSRLGGWIQSTEKQGFLFEQGPRSCRTSASGQYILDLVQELDLSKELIWGSPHAQQRFLYHNQTLQKLPSNPFSFLFNPLTRPYTGTILKECFKNKIDTQDVSIDQFFKHHFNTAFTDTFIDPLVSGIYAGDVSQLSMETCFPQIFELEQNEGSIMKGFLKKKKKSKVSYPSSLFSFKKGMGTLIQALEKKVEADILLNETALKVSIEANEVSVTFKHKTLKADHLISTLPGLALKPLFDLPFLEIPYATVAVVNFGYHKNVLKDKGFGYLIPSKERENILGCVWDSAVFPEQNNHSDETRLTCMLGGIHHSDKILNEDDCLQMALDSVAKHLNVQILPSVHQVKIAKHCIPQYPVGYQQQLQAVKNYLKQFSTFSGLGTSFHGVAVNECVQAAHQFSTHFQMK